MDKNRTFIRDQFDDDNSDDDYELLNSFYDSD